MMSNRRFCPRVILSGVTASQREAVTQSKDGLLPVCPSLDRNRAEALSEDKLGCFQPIRNHGQ